MKKNYVVYVENLKNQLKSLQLSINSYDDQMEVISDVYLQGTKQRDKFKTDYTDPYVIRFGKEYEALSLERQGYLNKREKVLNQLEKVLPMRQDNVD